MALPPFNVQQSDLSEPSPRFTKVDPNKTCASYGTGSCCNDLHFDPSEVMPSMGDEAVCRTKMYSWKTTTDKSRVNCLDCIELINS